MINKADSIKVLVSAPKVRTIVVTPDVWYDMQRRTQRPQPYEIRLVCREVLTALNAWLYSREES